MCNVVHEYFQTCKMPKACNATNMVILPKVGNPSSAMDFRPISYCNVVYKCIAKLICNKLKRYYLLLLMLAKGHLFMGGNLYIMYYFANKC